MNQVTPKPLPLFYVGKDLTRDRIEKFKLEKLPLLSQALGKPDTERIWYSRDHFAQLLEEIDLAGGDGIRVHFGAYEEGHEFEGQLCLLFTSTREKLIGSTVVHSNVVLENELDYPDRSALPRTIIFPGDDPFEGDIKDFNFGSPCPPRCDDDDDDDDDEGGN